MNSIIGLSVGFQFFIELFDLIWRWTNLDESHRDSFNCQFCMADPTLLDPIIDFCWYSIQLSIEMQMIKGHPCYCGLW